MTAASTSANTERICILKPDASGWRDAGERARWRAGRGGRQTRAADTRLAGSTKGPFEGACAADKAPSCHPGGSEARLRGLDALHR